jgi:hypothetical protein
VEAKPKGTKEPTLSVATRVVEKFLDGREQVSVYQWPPFLRRQRRWYEENDDLLDDDDDCMDDDEFA